MMFKSAHSRRRFLRGLGLGAGASVLLPLADRWVGRAQGATGEPAKRLILFSVYMMEPENYRPMGLLGDEPRSALPPTPVTSWPAMYGPLAPYMDRAVFVDGLKNHIGTHQHRAGTSALSCLNPTNEKPESLGPAGGQTIDQFMADTLSAGAPRKSLLWGLTGDALSGRRETQSGVFASGRGTNLSHFTSARSMLEQVFPDNEGGGGMMSSESAFRPVRDRLLSDLSRLRSGLASEERLSLDSFEESLLEFDARQEALASLTCDSRVDVPAEDAGPDADPYLESMMLQSSLALQCGLTNVVGVTMGTSNNHNKHMPRYEAIRQRSEMYPEFDGFYGHGKGEGVKEARIHHRFHWHTIHFEHLARMFDQLAQISEADGSSALDHTALVYVTGNGVHRGGHHAARSNENYWPAFLWAGARTGLRTEGRFMKYKHHWRGEGPSASLVDFYRTVARGLGVPNVQAFSSSLEGQGLITDILHG